MEEPSDNCEIGIEGGAPKYVLCRPLGGLNDIFCQIEACWRYAEKSGRVLVVDAFGRRFTEELLNCLEPISETSNVVLNPSQALLCGMNHRSVFPNVIQGRVSSYEPVQIPSLNPLVRFDGLTSTPITFDLSESYNEEVLVHHAEGGGLGSQSFLQRVRIKDSIAIEIDELLTFLPERYSAAHVRNSDYLTDYKWFLKKVQREAKGATVLVCSDSAQVLQFVAGTLSKRGFLTFPEDGSWGQSPIHLDKSLDASENIRRNVVRLLAEFVAIRGATCFYFTYSRLATSFTARPVISGFGRLAAHVVQLPRHSEFFGLLDRTQDISKSGRRARLISKPVDRFWDLSRKYSKEFKRLRRSLRRKFRRLVLRVGQIGAVLWK